MDPIGAGRRRGGRGGDLPDRHRHRDVRRRLRGQRPPRALRLRQGHRRCRRRPARAASQRCSHQSATLAQLNKVVEQRDFGANLARDIARADLKLKVSEFLAIWAASIVGIPLAHVRLVVRPAGAAAARSRCSIGALIGFLLPRFWLEPPQGRPAQRLQQAAAGHDHARSPTRCAPARRSSRRSSSSFASRARRSRPSSAGSSARSTSDCRSSRPSRTWSGASGRTTSS